MVSVWPAPSWTWNATGALTDATVGELTGPGSGRAGLRQALKANARTNNPTSIGGAEAVRTNLRDMPTQTSVRLRHVPRCRNHDLTCWRGRPMRVLADPGTRATRRGDTRWRPPSTPIQEVLV